MAEYIEREYLLDLYKGFDTPEYEKLSVPCPVVYQNVLDVPAADVVEVRRGRWVWKRRHHGGFRKYMGVDEFGETHTITVDERSECDEPYCPYCGKWNESVFRHYCPNCGAKMDGGKDDAAD